ncbi:MAG: AMP-binding protein [Acidimicrobiia bacterium]|nr:AMP-binding protein [Acidimicrobiia bacterium]
MFLSEPTVERDIPDDQPTSLSDLLHRSVEAYGERRALITLDAQYSYRDLAELANRYARALVAGGAGKGSRVALLMENDPHWVAFAFGATSIGALLVPISTFVHRDDLAYQLAHEDVEHLFMSAGFLDNDYSSMLAEIVPEIAQPQLGRLFCRELPALHSVVVRGADELPAGCRDWDDFLASGDDVSESKVRALQAATGPEDECYLLATSGTTARPKGVLHTHGAIAGNGSLIGDYQGLCPEDVVWFYFPLFFSAGCINVMVGTLSHGAALILQPSFDAGLALELIERERATTWHLWLHQLNQLLEHPDWNTRDHSGLHKGTGPYDVLCETPPPDGLGGVNMYGMTETATAFSCTRADEPLDIRMNTQGHLLPGNEIEVRDPETGARLPVGETGEFHVKGPSVMRGYDKVDPTTVFDAEGFFATGDLGRVDADGRVHFEQRRKDVIKTGGINVSPAEVEASLVRIPGVDAAYVFGLADDDKGELVGATLVPEPGASLDETTVTEFCRAELPGYKRPKAVLVLTPDAVPMTGSGKVTKHVLRDRLLRALDRGAGPFVDER